jgi:hypothetical protein
MSDDFDLRLRKELRALADAVPMEATVRPSLTPTGVPVARLDGSRPVVGRVRVRHGLSVGWSAAGLGLVLAIVVGVAWLGGLRNARPGASATPTTHLGSPVPTALSGLTTIQPDGVLSFGADGLTGLVLGPDGAAYVLDDTVHTVYQVNLDTGAKVAVVSAGQQLVSGGATVADPRLLATGGGDLLVLDSDNSVWRWHPAQGNKIGFGSLIQMSTPDNVSWGVGARAMGTLVSNAVQNLYGLYIVVPSQDQILKYASAPDGSGYPTATRSSFFMTAQDVSNVDDMYIDGQLYLAHGGKITRYSHVGVVDDWSPADPGGPAPYYTLITGDGSAPGQLTVYGYDRANSRIVAFSKVDGALLGQYAAPAGTPWLSSLTGMFVTSGVGGTTLYWTASGNLMSAVLASPGSPVATLPTASGSPGNGFTAIGPMTTDGGGPATLLQDGRVLVLSADGRAELYDPGTGEFSPTGSMKAPRAAETATLLRDGRVLIAGGYNDPPKVLGSAEIYDPKTGKFSPTGSMKTARSGETATLLGDGRVLIAGGDDGTRALSSAEIYDPSAATFSPTGPMMNGRAGLAATLLQGGRVLITGGVGSGSATTVAEVYDPGTGKFSPTGSMVPALVSQTATILTDGRVLIAGGGDLRGVPTARAQLYDPRTGELSDTGSMAVPREGFTATLLPDGRVMVAGGSGDNGAAFTSVELFDPRTGQFSSTGPMRAGRAGHRATLLADGRVLITGGGPIFAELYQP